MFGLDETTLGIVDAPVREIKSVLAAVSLELKSDGGKVELEISLTEPTVLAVPAVVDIDPDTLNLKSRGKWITAYIELPESYPVDEIDKNTVAIAAVDNGRLAQPVLAFGPTEVGDHDGDGIPDLMVKFDRAAVQALLQPGEVELKVSGRLVDGLPFEGSDTIMVR